MDDTPPVPRKASRPAARPAYAERELAFVREYLRDGNATRAALAAGHSHSYKSASVLASRLLEKVRIQTLVAELAEQIRKHFEVDVRRIAEEWAIIALADVEHYSLSPDGRLVVEPGVPLKAARAVKRKRFRRRIVTDGRGRTVETQEGEIELHDKLQALKSLYGRLRDAAAAAPPDNQSPAGVGADFLVRLAALLQATEPRRQRRGRVCRRESKPGPHGPRIRGRYAGRS